MRRPDREHDLDDELRVFVEMEAEARQQAGMSREEALRTAALKLRGIEQSKERVRAVWPGYALLEFLRDMRIAVRGLIRRPLFTAVIVFTLALAFGINASIYSLVDAILLRSPAGIRNPSRLVELARGSGASFVDLSYPILDHMRNTSTTLADLAVIRSGEAVIGEPDELEVVATLQVTGNYFDLLGLTPAAGRFPFPDESFHPEVAQAVVITHRLWEDRFGADPAIVGASLPLGGVPVTILGVTPPGFRGHVGLLGMDLFPVLGLRAPGLVEPESLDNADDNDVSAIARLVDGASRDAARDELTALAAAFTEDRGLTARPSPIRVDRYMAMPAGPRADAIGPFAVLVVVVVLLLAIACVNVANMLLARALERRREIATRLALGAGRGRIVRQLLTESLVLFIAAALAGLLIAYWSSGLLTSLLPALPVPLALRLAPDMRVFMLTLSIAAVAAILTGLVPALRATRRNLIDSIRGDSGGLSPRRSLLGRSLVGLQMAATVVLLVGSGLFVRAAMTTENMDLGFEPEGVWVGRLDLRLSGYDAERAERFFGNLRERVADLGGITQASFSHKLPLGSSSTLSGLRAEETPEGQAPPLGADFLVVDRGWFDTVRMPLLTGRDFGADDVEDAPRVAVINETMARQLWSGDEAVGRRFVLGGAVFEVIGVAADARYHGLEGETPRFVYLPLAQQYRMRWDRMFLQLRAESGMRPSRAQVESVIHSIDETVPLLDYADMRTALSMFFLPLRLISWVGGVAGLVCLILGIVGIYGVTFHAVNQRRYELGVRLALGSPPRRIWTHVVRRGMSAPLIGVALGVALALAVTHFVGALLVGVSALDPWTFGGVVVTLILVALVANALPALRAARVDPMSTLRAE